MNNTIVNQNSNPHINIVFICDENYVIPTAVSMFSLIKNKRSNAFYSIYLVCSSLSSKSENYLTSFAKDDVHITVIRQDVSKVANLHTHVDNSPCVASVSALLKFYLPELLHHLDRVLYLDGDLLVLEDITSLYNTELDNAYLAAVVDSGTLYTQNIWLSSVENYFNSGVMVLNLAKMRNDNLTTRLVKYKQDVNDSSLMDQNIFNLVCNKKIQLLPIRYNLLAVNLDRAKGSWTIDQVNERYGCSYSDIDDLFMDAAIVHFSSKDKPWKNASVVFANKWFGFYFDIPINDTVYHKNLIQALYAQYSALLAKQVQTQASLHSAWDRNTELKEKLQNAWDRNADLKEKLTLSQCQIQELTMRLHRIPKIIQNIFQ